MNNSTALKIQGGLEVVKLDGRVVFFKPNANGTQFWKPKGWALRDTATGFFLGMERTPNYPYTLRRKKDAASVAETVAEWGAFAIGGEMLA